MNGPKPRQRVRSKDGVRVGAHHDQGDAHSHSKKDQVNNLKGALAQTVLLGIIFFFLSSYLVTDTWLWGYNGKYANWRRWIPRKQLVFTQEELKQYDGSDPNKNIYLAIKGEVFDVTLGRPYYGKGGGYGFFSGRDASRAYTTGCFQTHLTHDLRGLNPQQLADIDGWANFYRNHAKYYKVGTVILDPIDPLSPLPEDCRAPSQPKPAS
ncbi:hypothetical protein MVEG_04308 [Podila verticillata NRRL 6337]|nr:MAG: cytochrome b5-like heme/steroid binding domain-containing protein [Podila humilis]KFH69496.1 hypothetical protein MVEG_04308 [Podila verticillata NRRL 6337]